MEELETSEDISVAAPEPNHSPSTSLVNVPLAAPEPTSNTTPTVVMEETELAQPTELTQRLVKAPAKWWAAFGRWRERHLVWQRLSRVQRWRLVMVIVFLVAFFAPLLTLGATALLQYNQLKGWGQDGVNQLLAIKNELPSSSSSSSSDGTSTTINKAKDILNKTTLAAIAGHCQAAQADFNHINTAIANRDGIIGLAITFGFKAKIDAVQQLAIVGIDGTVLCQKLTTLGADFTDTFKTSPFSTTGGPILTQKSFTDLETALDDTQVRLTDIEAHVQQINFNDVPVSASQRQQLQKYLGYLPKALSDIANFKPYLPLMGWAVGVDAPRNYLVQTMDRGELRPSGGFNGQWGILNINGGRMGSLSLTDVTFVDFTSTNGWTLNQPTPKPYDSWWPIVHWGVRDGDLSGDFPTTAKLIMGSFQREEAAVSDGIRVHLDGDVHFSPVVIEHLLVKSILGPIYMPCYNDTITSDNLEARLHYYQEDPSSIAIQNKCSPSTGHTSSRKRFTSQLAQALEARVRSANQATLLAILGSVKNDLLAKNLEIYVNNPDIESLLAKDHLDGSINTNPAIDSTTIIQSNFGVNKGSTQVSESINENIQLDDSGGAFHDVQLVLDYHPVQPVYGQPIYRDYVRIYVPPNAQFNGGAGFDENIQPMYTYTQSPATATPLCKVSTPTPTPTPTLTPSPTSKPGKGKPTPVPGPGTPTPGAGTPPLDAGIPQLPATMAAPPLSDTTFPCTPAEAPNCYQGSFGTSLAHSGSTAEWINNRMGSNSGYIDDIGGPTNFVSDITDAKGNPERAMYGGIVVVPPFCVATVDVQYYVPNIAGKGTHNNLPYTFMLQRQSGTYPNYHVIITPASDTKAATIDVSGTNPKNPLSMDMSWSLSVPQKHKADLIQGTNGSAQTGATPPFTLGDMLNAMSRRWIVPPAGG